MLVDRLHRDASPSHQLATRGRRGLSADIPWREMAGMRDKLIHGYFSVDLDAVWKTVTTDLPKLKSAVLRELKGTGSNSA
ncbi:MAG: DUF86 domain-containing protein [Gemmatimonadota bacterium]